MALEGSRRAPESSMRAQSVLEGCVRDPEGFIEVLQKVLEGFFTRLYEGIGKHYDALGGL